MRDREKIILAGRSDPDSPVEMRQHPYDFASFPNRVSMMSDICLRHDKYDGGAYSGKATFRMRLISPVHVGSGIYELSEDVGFPSNKVVRGITRKDGEPIVPGSSIKGAVRSNYESITKSCVRIHKSFSREKYDKKQRHRSKLPNAVISGLNRSSGKIQVELRGVLKASQRGRSYACPELKSRNGIPPETISLCPACALFGGMGYKGRITFGDATIITSEQKPQPVGVVALNTPHLHRAGFKIDVRQAGGREKIEVSQPYGRKFYYQSDIDGGDPNTNDLIDYIPADSVLEFVLNFNDVLEAEIGGILVSLGINQNFPFRIGGGKPIGLGMVKVELVRVEQSAQPAERFRAFNSHPSEVDCVAWIAEKREIFERWTSYNYLSGLEQIEMITAKKRPTQEEADNAGYPEKTG